MLVTVRNNDNTDTSYGFAPEHKAQAIGFYTALYWEKAIKGFTATLDSGETVTVGAD